MGARREEETKTIIKVLLKLDKRRLTPAATLLDVCECTQ